MNVLGDAKNMATTEEHLAELERSKNTAYDERNRLVALVSSLFPSSLSRHPVEDKEWEADWRWIVVVQFPTGQASWHIHDSHLVLFAHLERRDQKWDGHTSQEKYERIANLTRTQERHAAMSAFVKG